VLTATNIMTPSSICNFVGDRSWTDLEMKRNATGIVLVLYQGLTFLKGHIYL
jgi:hypothetical protein